MSFAVINCLIFVDNAISGRIPMSIEGFRISCVVSINKAILEFIIMRNNILFYKYENQEKV